MDAYVRSWLDGCVPAEGFELMSPGACCSNQVRNDPGPVRTIVLDVTGECCMGSQLAITVE